MKVCKQCGRKYMNTYTNNYGCSYTQETVFCSKQCSSIYQRGGLSKKKLEEEVVNFVINKNRYCLKSEILSGIQRSSKTFIKHKVSIVDIQKVLGFTKPKSVFQEKVYSELKKHFTDIICEYTHKSILSPKGYSLRIDFFIPSRSLMIEADGTQHSDESNPWYSDYNKMCDQNKDAYCKSAGITMLRVPYTEKVTESFIKQYLSTII